MDSAILRITSGFCEGFIPSAAEIRTALLIFVMKSMNKFSIMN